MDASAKHHEVLAGNLANIDTPGYKARRMNFEAIMSDYEDQRNMGFQDSREPAKGMPPAPVLNFQDYVVEEVNDHLTERFDGNNVNLDEEMAEMAKMRGRYQMASAFMSRRIGLLNEIINSR
jgi:flagellar basal-body rod protein FlgB